MTNTCVIASYKYGHLAAHCIETVLAQTKPFDKIFLVDDGVGDCHHLENTYPEVEFIHRENNLGIVKNFQDMLNRVETDRVMFLGADNWLREDTMEILSESKEDVVVYDIMVVGDRRNEILNRHPDQVTTLNGSWYWNRMGGHHGSMLYSTKQAKVVGGYDSPPGRTVEDLILYNRLIANGSTVEHIPQALLFYRRHRDNFNPC